MTQKDSLALASLSAFVASLTLAAIWSQHNLEHQTEAKYLLYATEIGWNCRKDGVKLEACQDNLIDHVIALAQKKRAEEMREEYLRR